MNYETLGETYSGGIFFTLRHITGKKQRINLRMNTGTNIKPTHDRNISKYYKMTHKYKRFLNIPK